MNKQILPVKNKMPTVGRMKMINNNKLLINLRCVVMVLRMECNHAYEVECTHFASTNRQDPIRYQLTAGQSVTSSCDPYGGACDAFDLDIITIGH